jgi:hypothetical protein
MRWQHRASGNAGAAGHNKVLRMKAKMNRYDLSLWDVRKLQLYGTSRNSVQNRDSSEQSRGRFSHRVLFIRALITGSGATDLLYLNQDGIKRGRVAHVGKFF